MYKYLVLLPLFYLVGCVAHQTQNITSQPTMYDYQLTQSGVTISLSDFVLKQMDADVILVGEWHTHPGVHLFQADLLQALSYGDQSVVLAMEQFSRDNQSVLDEYLEGKIGEQALIKQADAWTNYQSDYRPLVEYAKSNEMQVIAANAPNDIVRCINKTGLNYLNNLADEQRQYVAKNISTADSEYKDKFVATMHHGTKEQIANLFAAQMTRDETMAESIVNILNKYPSHKVLLTAGKFHVEGGLGVASSILKRNPHLKIIVINPVSTTATESDDEFQLNVLPLPLMYAEGEDFKLGLHFTPKKKPESKCE